MKSNYMNYFKDGKLYQWDKDNMIFTIEKVENIQGEFCLDKKGMDMLLKFNNPTLEIKDNALIVKSGKMKAKISLIDGILMIPDLEFDKEFKVDCSAIKNAAKFVQSKGRNSVLEGVSIRQNHVQATDSLTAYRKEAVEGDAELILPVEFIAMLPNTGELQMKARENSVACVFDNKLIVSKLLAGKYSDIERIFSIQGDFKSIEIPTNELKSILDYSMNAKDVKDVKEVDNEDRLRFENNKIKITGTTDFEAELDLDIDISITFILAKIRNVINQITTDTIKFSYMGSMRPVFINDNYLVLPIKEA